MRESLKTYESADEKLRLEPPTNPNVGYGWMPGAPKRLDVEERDIIFLERGSRATCRALNMAEVVLQAWDPEKTELKVALRMRKSISRAVKAMMQIQVATTCGLLQLRRDHVLAAVRGLSVDNIQRLRHAPILEETKLFPPELLKELNEVNYQSLQTRALLRQVRGDIKQPSQGGISRGEPGSQQPIQHLSAGSAQKSTY